MEKRNFGRAGWNVSEIGFGAWAISGEWGEQADHTSVDALNTALDLGVNFIDTAMAYGNGRSEEVIGQVLKQRSSSSENIIVATKIPPTQGQWPPFPEDKCERRYPEKYLRESVDISRRRLQMDTLDLVQLHTWTRSWNKNPSALEYLKEIKDEGKIKAIGISTPEQDQNALIQLMREGWLDSVQVIYNIFEREPEAEFLAAAAENNVGVIVRCVMDEGALTGKFTEDTVFADNDFRYGYFAGDRLKQVVSRVEAIRRTVEKFPEEDADNLASVAIRFVLQHPAVSTIITGVRTPEQARRNCAVSGTPALGKELYKELRQHAWRRYFW